MTFWGTYINTIIQSTGQHSRKIRQRPPRNRGARATDGFNQAGPRGRHRNLCAAYQLLLPHPTDTFLNRFSPGSRPLGPSSHVAEIYSMLPVIRYTCYLAPHCWQVITPDDFLVNFVPSWYTRVLQFLHYAPLA